METKLQQEINEVLKAFPEYWDEDTLLKNKLIEDIRLYNEKIIEALLSNELIRDTYSFQLQSGAIFKVEEFINMLRFKNYWDNSYTKYTNEIGLTSENKYLKYNTDVVLDFPHKDGILEGGMSKEEIGKREIYYHNIIAKEEIDTLLAPKVLTKTIKYDEDGEHTITDMNETDNLILKGNNLIALSLLKKRFRSKVKLIYIDPPYNTGSDSFRYNDNFNRSTWLTFMKNRLDIAQELLKEEGVIFIQCDDNEQAYLKVLADNIFGENNFLNTISLNAKVSAGASGGGEDKRLKKNVEYIHVYVKNTDAFNAFNPIFKKTELMKYIASMKEDNKSFKYTSVLYRIDDIKYYKTIQDGSGDDIIINKVNDYEIKSIKQISKIEGISEKEAYEKYYDKVMTTTNAQTSIRDRVWEATDSENNMFAATYYPKSGKNKAKKTTIYFVGKQKVLVIWLKDTTEKIKNEIYKKEKIGTYWDGFSWINVNKEGGVSFSSGKKPEGLMQRIIEMATEKDEIVLDFFSGSGTTSAVAHKLGRRYIGIEQMDYTRNLVVTRMQNVIKGDQTGISKNIQWEGGGSFVYAELYSLNEKFLHQIQTCSNHYELNVAIEEMKKLAYLNFRVNLEKITTKNEDFNSLSLDEQKDVLIQVLDMNQLYLNYSEIEDSQYDISDSVKAFNHSFYQKEGDQNE